MNAAVEQLWKPSSMYEHHPRPPERMSNVSALVNQAQESIVQNYDLNNGFAGMERAADYVYPKKQFPGIDQRIQSYWEKNAANVFQYNSLGLPFWYTLNPKALYDGKPLFKDLHPVIFFSPPVIDTIKQAKYLGEVMNKNTFKEFGVVIEETSHFIYSQVHYDLYGSMPSNPILEAMALVDTYMVMRDLFQQQGQSITDRSNTTACGAIRFLFQKMRGYKKFPEDFQTQAYHDAADIIEGYLSHIIKKDAQGNDISEEVSTFYHLSDREKLQYLSGLNTYLSDINPNQNYHLGTINSLLGEYDEDSDKK